MSAKKAMGILGFFAVSVLLVPSRSDAAVDASFCGKWKSAMSDAGIGEDYLGTDSIDVSRPAQYTSSTVYEVVPGPDISVWNGILNENGCVYVEDLEVDTTYRFRIRSIAKWSATRLIYVQDEDASVWTTDLDYGGYVIHDVFFTPRKDGTYRVTNEPVKDFETNVMPIAGKIWDRVEDSEIQLPVAVNILIRGSADGYSYAGTVTGTYRGVWVRDYSGRQRKFIAGHEIGHAAGDIWADMHGSDYSEPHEEDLCFCDHIDTDTDDCAHCLQSLETIRAAENEGWAHFFSTTIFNDRDTASSWLGYYKDVNDWPVQFPDTDPTYEDCEADDSNPCPVDVTDDSRWMETYCNDDMAGQGVELDWLNFFWGLWTEDATYKYDMHEITDVWNQVHINDPAANHNEEWLWDDLVEAAEDVFPDTDKSDEFEDQGMSSGVDH